MKICLRLLFASFSVLALSGVVLPAHAQECVGLPSGRGILSVGMEGTDGATGSGVAFAYQTPAEWKPVLAQLVRKRIELES